MLEVGAVVDRYMIDAVLSRGTMADLYRVRHTLLHSEHVIKHARAESYALQHALIEEGRILSRIDSVNVLSITDALDIDNRPALVVQFVGDGDIADWLERWDQPPIADALSLFRGVALGVFAAHRAGVVHRDLKPENVLIRKESGRMIPKLTDFGLAKTLRKGANSMTLSADYSVIGTPEYMAPEQINSPGRVDPRADMFSLGVMLYELLTGRVPFDAEEPRAVMELIKVGRYTPLDEIRSGLNPVLSYCVDRLLQPDPDQRIADCRALLKLLDRMRVG